MEVCDFCSIQEPNKECTCCQKAVVMCDSCFREERWQEIVEEHIWRI